MKILVIGGGGREHAIGWRIKQDSPDVSLYFLSGNGGTLSIGENLSPDTDPVEFGKQNSIDLTVVGPESPLVDGIVDRFRENGLKIFGPDKRCARLEGDKGYAKEFMKRYNVPTADYEEFDDFDSAVKYAEKIDYPHVIKAVGLAAGKGSIIVYSKKDAINTLEDIMINKRFGEAGNRVVMERFLEGREASIIGIFGGGEYILLKPSKDHKKIFDGDKGPNTGGMGAFSPVPDIDDELLIRIERMIFKRMKEGFERENMDFTGVLYAGIMLTDDGVKVLEFNVRFGDPETQCLLPMVNSGFVDTLFSVSEGSAPSGLEWRDGYCVCVVLASKGYPGKYEKGKEIKFFSEPEFLFHAGTKYEDGKLYTSGGRVMNVVGIGETLKEAREKAYKEIGKIYFEGMYFRKDIGGSNH